jgi:hypothetical protein
MKVVTMTVIVVELLNTVIGRTMSINYIASGTLTVIVVLVLHTITVSGVSINCVLLVLCVLIQDSMAVANNNTCTDIVTVIVLIP